MNIDQLAPDEQLSPELVLVLSPELRAQALARLGPLVWPAPRRPAVEGPAFAPAPYAVEPLVPALGAMLVARVAQLALVFVAVTLLVLAMSLVANAMR